MGHRSIVKKEDREWRRMRAESERERLKVTESIDSAKKFLRPATASDWQRFLDIREKPCTHFYNYDLPGRFYVATGDVEIPAACGSSSIQVIAPVGISVTHGGGITHNNIHRMDDPDGSFFAPSYNNANQG